jgi:mRNA interferase MazF
MSEVQRGEVYMVKPDPSNVGKEILKKRPCVVVSSNIVNINAGLVVVCPITEGIGLSASMIHVPLKKGEGGLTKDSFVLCEQIKAVGDERVNEKLGNLNAGIMQKIDAALRDILNLHKN